MTTLKYRGGENGQSLPRYKQVLNKEEQDTLAKRHR